MASRLVELARASPMTSLVQTLIQYGGRSEESCDAQHTPNGDEQGVTQRLGDAPERGAASGRHRRREGIQELPGGVLDQQSDDEMREQPAAGERLAPRGQAVEAEQAFQALEREFHLPTQAIHCKNRYLTCRTVSDDDVTDGLLQCSSAACATLKPRAFGAPLRGSGA
jgi:hypothetical protein